MSELRKSGHIETNPGKDYPDFLWNRTQNNLLQVLKKEDEGTWLMAHPTNASCGRGQEEGKGRMSWMLAMNSQEGFHAETP